MKVVFAMDENKIKEACREWGEARGLVILGCGDVEMVPASKGGGEEGEVAIQDEAQLEMEVDMPAPQRVAKEGADVAG